MKYFLDIDGVMVSGNSLKPVITDVDGFYKFEDDAVNSLNAVLKSDDEIILSTSHRFSYTIEDWKKILKRRGITETNVSMVEVVMDVIAGSARCSEIMFWVHRCRFEYDDVVIIDDDKSLNDLPKGLKERLVLTDSFFGLQTSSEITDIIK